MERIDLDGEPYNTKGNIGSAPLGRQNAVATARQEAQRFRDKAAMLDKLADDVEGHLSKDADMMLWVLLSSSRR